MHVLRERGFRVYATLPDPGAVSVEDVDVTTPIAVIFGNEHVGVSPAAVAACDGAVTVPMFGFTESYNLSVTVGLCMSRLAVRRRAHLGKRAISIRYASPACAPGGSPSRSAPSSEFSSENSGEFATWNQ